MYQLTSTDRNILKEALNDKFTKKYTYDLLYNGFIYGFKKDNNNIYIIPDELLNIYKEFNESDIKQNEDLAKINIYFMIYIFMNGVISKDFINDTLINYYGFNITEKDIKETVKEFSYNDYKNYYSLITGKSIEYFIQYLQTLEYEPIILPEEEIIFYSSIINSIVKKLSKIVKTDIANEILQKMLIQPKEAKELNLTINLDNKTLNKIDKIFSEYKDELRYWIYRGRTLHEVLKEMFKERAHPKGNKTDLKSILSKYDEDLLNHYYEIYKVKDIDTLKSKIIEKFKFEIENMTNTEALILLGMNNQEIDEKLPTNNLEYGFIHLYKYKNKIKYLIPDEIEQILLDNKNDFSIEHILNTIVDTYLNMNGVIEKNKLKEILKNYHNYDISIKELDKIISELNITIIDKYYTVIEDITIEEITNLMFIKNNMGDYRKLNIENDIKESEFIDKLKSIVDGIPTLKSTKEELLSILSFQYKINSLNKDNINNMLEELNLNIKENTKKQILDLYKEYKGYLSVWIYNGYTVTEKNKISKKEKIGRNDPCPCGSGKKYKQCCGK